MKQRLNNEKGTIKTQKIFVFVIVFMLFSQTLIVVSVSAVRYQTPNFVINTADPASAEAFGKAAEKYRRDLAIEWFGKEFPTWSSPCPVTIAVGPDLGAGGATTFSFDRGEVFGWRMTIQGSYERVMDSVLPHEINHMLFASYFREPLPRWADEGAATSVENQDEKNKHFKMLKQFLRTQRGIPFSRMFQMKEYPRDIMPVYSQGYTLAELLIRKGGKSTYIKFLKDGLASNDWNSALRTHYGVRRTTKLSETMVLQETWRDWIMKIFGYKNSGQVSDDFLGNANQIDPPSQPGQQPVPVQPVAQAIPKIYDTSILQFDK